MGREIVTRKASIDGVGGYEISARTTAGRRPVTIYMIDGVTDASGRTIDDDREFTRVGSFEEARRIAREILADHIRDRAARRRSRLDEL